MGARERWASQTVSVPYLSPGHLGSIAHFTHPRSIVNAVALSTLFIEFGMSETYFLEFEMGVKIYIAATYT